MLRLRFCILLAAVAFAADKPREWKPGKLVDSSSESFVTRGGSQTTGQVDRSGNYSGTTTQSTWKHRRYDYVIEAGDRIIVGEEVKSFRWSKPCAVDVGDVQIAVEKGHLFIKTDSGECKLKIVRQALKPR